VRAGLFAGVREFTQQSGSVALPASERGRTSGATFDLKLDQLAGANFPTSGWAANLDTLSEFTTEGRDGEYNRWRAAAITALTSGRHTFEFAASTGGKWGSNPIPAYDQFALGGFLNLSGLATGQLRTGEYGFARLVYRTKLADIPLFEGVYFGASAEVAYARPLIPVWRGEFVLGKIAIPAGSVYLGIDSPLGPLYVAFGYAGRDNAALYLFLGRP
jgi:NTE family protein